MNDKSSLIDFVFTSDDFVIDNLFPKPPLGKSDHVCIAFDLHLLTKPDELQTLSKDNLNFWRGDYVNLNAEFEKVNWNETLYSEDINTNWIAFKSKINSLADKFIPLKTEKKIISRPKWMTKKNS